MPTFTARYSRPGLMCTGRTVLLELGQRVWIDNRRAARGPLLKATHVTGVSCGGDRIDTGLGRYSLEDVSW